MKKSVLLLGISLFALTACNNSPVESIYSIPVEINKIRPYKNESSASIVMLKSALDLKTKVSMSKATDFDFVLFVTKFQCQGCADTDTSNQRHCPKCKGNNCNHRPVVALKCYRGYLPK